MSRDSFPSQLNLSGLLRLGALLPSLCLVLAFQAAAAMGAVPQVRPSLTLLDLSRPPSNQELRAAGQLGGQLYPTHEAAPKARESEMNLAFGEAIQAWNEHNYREAVEMFKAYVQKYPDSPWASEAILHVGCDALYHGRYSEAEGDFNRILKTNGASRHPGAVMLAMKARVRLANLKTAQGNFREAARYFRILKQTSPDWRDRTYASHWIQRLSLYKHKERAMLNCGVQALAHILKRQGKQAEARKIMAQLPPSARGHSVKDLQSIAQNYGYNLTGLKLSAAELKDVPLPAIVQLSARHQGDRGHYWVLEKIDQDTLNFFDPQSSRRFQQSPQEFTREWGGHALVFATREKLPGTILSLREMQGLYGGCCGVPRPENNLGNPENNDAGSCGAPVWDVNRINLNFFLTDTPMWYQPAIGPDVHLTLSYNSQSALAQHEPFGPKWQFCYSSYVVEDTGGNVTIFMPDGRRDVFTPDGSGGYTPPLQVFNTLTKIANNHFELRFLDDTVYNYNLPSGSNQSLLAEIVDAHGLKLTFGYNSSIQLTTITDALGHATTLTYTGGLVTKATDPFGRVATFTYDTGGHLRGITDMGGYWANFTYDADVYLQTLTNARGTWNFLFEPADGIDNGTIPYPPPQNTIPKPAITMWENYRITATDPNGYKQEYYYDGDHINGWQVKPKDYVPYADQSKNNYTSGRKANYYYSTIADSSMVSRIDFPAGGSLYFNFDDVGNRTYVDDNWGSYNFTYNDKGQVVTYTDAKSIITTLIYYPNNVDVQYVQNGLGSETYTYNTSHDILTYTDREGHTTTYAYNSYGQLQTKTDARGKVTVYNYDPNSHRLLNITVAGQLQHSFTYDSLGRVSTYTDPAGLTYGFAYNNLDQVTSVTYPDGKSMIYTYSTCCPRIIDSVTDCAGRTWFYSYDKLNRRIAVANPEGGVTRLGRDANGNLAEVVDPQGKITKYKYDSNNRLVKKIYDDNNYVLYTYKPVGETGLLASKRNARGATTLYDYDSNRNKTHTYYASDPYGGTTYAYDDYNRLTTVSNGVGSYGFTYFNNDWLQTMDGPWDNDTVTYTYDQVGNPLTLVLMQGQGLSFVHDDLNRLHTISNPAGTFTYNYVGSTPLVQSLVRPGGSATAYSYIDPLLRLTRLANQASLGGQVISQYDYVYNPQDQVNNETVTGVASTIMNRPSETNTYNNLNQLLSRNNPNPQTFTYDPDGNLIRGYTPSGSPFTATYDPENHLTSLTYSTYRLDFFYIGAILVQVKKYGGAGLATLISDIRYVYDAGFRRLQERNASNQVLNEYTWGLHQGGGIGGLLNLYQNGANYSYLYDGKDNVTALLNSSNTVQASYQYDPFGVPLTGSASVIQPMQFSTKPYDAETGLIYYGFRFYAPVLGRWLNRDPLEEMANDLNLYAFVANDPINTIDPFGLDWWNPWTWWGNSPAAQVGKDAAVSTAGTVVKNEAQRAATEWDMHSKLDKHHLGDIKSKPVQEYIQIHKTTCGPAQQKATESLSSEATKVANQAANSLGGDEGGSGSNASTPSKRQGPKIKEWQNK